MELDKRVLLVAGTVAAVLFATSCSSDDRRSEGTPNPPASSSTPQIRPVDAVATEQVDGMVFAGEGAVLSAGEEGVARIDPDTLRVQWQADVPAYRAAAGLGSVWATDLEGNLVRRLDALTGKIQAEIPVPGGPIGVIVHRGSVWVGGHRDGTVSRIDPGINKVVSVTRVAPAGPAGPFDLAASGDHVYVDVYSTHTVVRIDVRSAEVTRRVKVPDYQFACGALTVDGPIVWVTGCLESDRVIRVDMRNGGFTSSEPLRFFVGGGVLRDDVIWFAGAPVEPGDEAAFVGLDRTTLGVVGLLRAEDTVGSAVAAFGSWWVAQQHGVARFRLEDLVVGP